MPGLKNLGMETCLQALLYALRSLDRQLLVNDCPHQGMKMRPRIQHQRTGPMPLHHLSQYRINTFQVAFGFPETVHQRAPLAQPDRQHGIGHDGHTGCRYHSRSLPAVEQQQHDDGPANQ